DVDLYKPRKRKRNQKSSEDKEKEEPKLKEVKKEAGTTSESVTEKVVAEKAEVVVEKESDAAVVEKPKKKDL
ncbi:hypothetical protein A2U01_0108059, partial [Trifolium medium]|nr:hypothetical protein [Trifolium medium]